MIPFVKNFFLDQTAPARFLKFVICLIPLLASELTGLITPDHLHILLLLSAICNAFAASIPTGNKNSDPAHPPVTIIATDISTPPKGYASTAVMVSLALAMVGLAGCAFLSRAKANEVACIQADPTTVTRVTIALMDLPEQQWVAAVTELVPDPEIRKCLLMGIINAAIDVDGGDPFSFLLSDGGVVTADLTLTSAKALGETNRQRIVRRARTYLAITTP